MSQSEQLSQPEYNETPYCDVEWEVVGERFDTENFTPLQIEVVPRARVAFDPMFANYGGIPKNSQKERWHLPEGETFQAATDPKSAKSKNALEQPAAQASTEQIEALKQQLNLEMQARFEEQLAEKLAQQASSLSTRFENIFKDQLAQQQEHLAQLEQLALSLALAISKKLLDNAVEVNPEYIVPIINQAITQSGSAKIKAIKVSLQDLEFIELEGIQKRLKAYDGSWVFEADENIKSGCILETSGSTLDFQLDQAWERIKESVIKSNSNLSSLGT